MEIQANKTLFRDIEVRKPSKDLLEKRQAEFVISNETEDRHGTVFRSDGWDLTYYKKNPIVLYNHGSYSDNPDNIIGTGEVFKEGKSLIGRVTFEDAETNPLAERVFKKIQKGTLRMASVGAVPHDGEWGDEERGENPDTFYFNKHELVEWSVVPIGSNRDALKRNADNLDEIKKSIVREKTIEETVEDNKQLLSIREAQLLINKTFSNEEIR